MKREIVVPADFVTNFVSFAPLKYVGIRAAVVHDFLYCCSNVDRRMADKVLLEALHVVKVRETLAHEMFIAVRACGSAFRDETPYTLGGEDDV
jgi:ubiquinone biosynthesis protein Coq4